MNKLYYSITILLSLLLATTACSKTEKNLGHSYIKPEEESREFTLLTAKAADVPIIYDGSESRQVWTVTQSAPYVSYVDPETKKEDWLFDGFLIMEVKDGKGHVFADSSEPGVTPATKTEWEWLLNVHFTKGRGMDALNTQIGEVAKRIGQPVRKRKIIYALPDPVWKQTDWGILNGKVMDFNEIADRIAAESWFIDQFLAKWKATNFENLELAGFYWIREAIWNNLAYTQVAENVAKFIHSKPEGYHFYWIPYSTAGGRDQWRTYGFDVAWLQPNIAFEKDNPKVPTIQTSFEFAKKNGMGMEFESNIRALKGYQWYEPWARDRAYVYINFYRDNGIWENYPMTYYFSQWDWGYAVTSTNADDIALARDLGRIIVDRQKRADALYQSSK